MFNRHFRPKNCVLTTPPKNATPRIIACKPKDVPAPDVLIHFSWKKPTQKPPVVLHRLMIAATKLECFGNESRQYADTAVVPAIIENAIIAQEIRTALSWSTFSMACP